MLSKLTVLFFMAGAGFSAGADITGLFAEPGLTYQRLESSIDYPAPFSNSKGKVSGFGLMGRVGFHVSEIIFVAADARYARPSFEDSTNSLSTTADEYDLGPVIGLQTPIVGLRVWATWIMTSQLDPKESNGFDYKFNDGSGWRIGAGFHVLMLSLNLEYQRIKYASTSIEKIGPFTSGTGTDSIKFNGDGIVLSVSFPLEL